MSAAEQLYPLSTDKGEAIPLEIVRPVGAMRFSTAADTALSITIPSTYALVSIVSSIDMIFDPVGTLTYPVADGVDLGPSFILLSDVIYTLALPALVAPKLIPSKTGETGIVYMNCLQKWAGLGLARQLATR